MRSGCDENPVGPWPPPSGKTEEYGIWEGSLRQFRDSGFAILLIVAFSDAMEPHLFLLRRTLDKKCPKCGKKINASCSGEDFV